MRTSGAVVMAVLLAAACGGSTGSGVDAGYAPDAVTPSSGGAGGVAGSSASEAALGGMSGGSGGSSVDGSVSSSGGTAGSLDASGLGGKPGNPDAAAGGSTGTDAGTSGDAGGSVYSGCSYIGGIDRALVGKFDAQSGRCVAILLISPGGRSDAGAGLTVTDYWGVDSIMLWPVTAAGCAQLTRPPGAIFATGATGSMTVDRSVATIDVDATLTFPASDAGPLVTVEMKAKGVSLRSNCF